MLQTLTIQDASTWAPSFSTILWSRARYSKIVFWRVWTVLCLNAVSIRFCSSVISLGVVAYTLGNASLIKRSQGVKSGDRGGQLTAGAELDAGRNFPTRGYPYPRPRGSRVPAGTRAFCSTRADPRQICENSHHYCHNFGYFFFRCTRVPTATPILNRRFLKYIIRC